MELDEFFDNHVVILALWHPYKQALHVIWKKFFCYFTGPAQHALFPNNIIFQKPKLLWLEPFLLRVLRAYLPLRQMVDDAIIKCSSVDHTNVLKNLKWMCEEGLAKVFSLIA